MSRDFLLLVFFRESSSTKPLIIALESFHIFLKILRDICTTGINDTGGKFATNTASVVDTNKFAAGVYDTGGK